VSDANFVLKAHPDEPLAGQFNVELPVAPQGKRDRKDREREYERARRCRHESPSIMLAAA
jgi:hypothetical protein